MTRIAVVIHLSSLIALVLEFEPDCDEHGSCMAPGLDHVVLVTDAGGLRNEEKAKYSPDVVEGTKAAAYWLRPLSLLSGEAAGSGTWFRPHQHRFLSWIVADSDAHVVQRSERG